MIDWAWRKGQRYGTLLCDHESGRTVDLLPERDSESLEQWLRAHPGVRIVTRDRYAPYIPTSRRSPAAPPRPFRSPTGGT